jgi:hypothetical protein
MGIELDLVAAILALLGALSRLRTCGFAARLETRGERRAYCLERGEG